MQAWNCKMKMKLPLDGIFTLAETSHVDSLSFSPRVNSAQLGR